LTAGILYRDTIVGVIGYNRLDFTNHIGTIGYWLGEKYQHQGIMTKTVAAITTYGFEELRLNRIEIRVAPENKSSIAITERIHFSNEGRLRQAVKLYER